MRGGGGAIPHAVEAARLIEASPTLRAEHDRLKASVQVVYRGLGFSSDDERVTSKDVVAEERRRGMVAASRWEEAAVRFAYMVGHLESRSARRSAYGYVLTYHLTPDAIVLCTELFGGSYAEFEVVIDTTRATLAGIEAV